MKPDDIVMPTKLCMSVIHKLKPHHRGVVLPFPDYECKTVRVQWNHKSKPSLMARRYVEMAAELTEH